jgi:hypothetical protein
MPPVLGDSNTTVAAVSGLNTDAMDADGGDGVIGESQNGEGVRGVSHNPNRGGVVGICDKPNGIAVFGFCDDGSGSLVGQVRAVKARAHTGRRSRLPPPRWPALTRAD